MTNSLRKHILLKPSEKYTFDLQLHDNITLLSGDSATGKSLIYQLLESNFLRDKARLLDTDFTKVLLINYKNFMQDSSILNTIYTVKDYLIFIDNADIVLDNNIKVSDYISRDKENTYIIAARGFTGIRTSPTNCATLQLNNNVISLKYETTGVSSWLA